MNAFTFVVWLSDNTAHIQITLQFLEKLWKTPLTDEAKAAASMIHLPSTQKQKKGNADDDDNHSETNGNNQKTKTQKQKSEEVTTAPHDAQEEDEEEEENEEEEEDEEEEEENEEEEEDEEEEEEEEEEEKDWFLESQLRKLNTNPKTKASALRNWIWLISGLPLGGIASLLDSYEPELTPLLLAHDVGLRCAAGEALTLLITSYQEALPDQDLAEEYELEHCGEFVKLRDESDKKRKSSEMKKQRQEFRDFVRSVSEHWKPDVAIKLQGNEIELQGWSECIPYYRVKDILKGGMQVHLKENKKVQTRLQIDAQELFALTLNKVLFFPYTFFLMFSCIYIYTIYVHICWNTFSKKKKKTEKEKKQKTSKKSARIQKESRKEKRMHKNAFRFESTDHNDVRKRKLFFSPVVSFVFVEQLWKRIIKKVFFLSFFF
ncbi:hypothetical protein RFI_16138 [Reticulomyxa filosa]|uniref:Interferon-related developmental regulator N-terminal domain-containing protein n=1 Tax=Reticulomyxa filosa TaxID=46433 RepID=X6N4V9_RETFI|nr:hypothetical protein RFI_16138 [Reticulomyxa filosa]|eukprot:ETO21066.1 hypothetical protein RFI_16138 [Reticulomyxa filosa]